MGGSTMLVEGQRRMDGSARPRFVESDRGKHRRTSVTSFPGAEGSSSSFWDPDFLEQWDCSAEPGNGVP